MKLGVVGGMMALVLFAGACKQGAMNDSEAKNVTGSEDGKGDWRQLKYDELTGTDRDTGRASSAFGYLNPGYALISEGYFVKSADDYNQPHYKATQYRFRIAKINDDKIGATVATTPYTVQTLRNCEGDTTGAGRGVFVGGKLIGINGRICEDVLIGMKYCNDNKQLYVVAGCTIPKMNGKEISGEAIVFK